VECDVIGLGQESGQGDAPRSGRLLQRRVPFPVGIDHVEPEAAGPQTHRRSDPPRPHDPQGFPAQIAAQEKHRSPGAEAPPAQEPLRLREPAGGGEQERPGEVGDGVGQDPGRVADRDRPNGRGGEIDVVEADRHQGDPLERGSGVEETTIDGVGEKAEQAVFSPGGPDELPR
jgi:hypothetical protein